MSCPKWPFSPDSLSLTTRLLGYIRTWSALCLRLVSSHGRDLEKFFQVWKHGNQCNCLCLSTTLLYTVSGTFIYPLSNAVQDSLDPHPSDLNIYFSLINRAHFQQSKVAIFLFLIGMTIIVIYDMKVVSFIFITIWNLLGIRATKLSSSTIKNILAQNH